MLLDLPARPAWRCPVLPVRTDLPARKARKARPERGVSPAEWWSVALAKRVLPAPLARKAPPGSRVRKAIALRVLPARGDVRVPRAYKA